ncbi:hypothetical protein ACFL0B_07600 [Thermodesulfobacteriota bacterium]
MKISTTQLGKRKSLEPKEMFSKLEKLGLIIQKGQKRTLTDKGKKMGGEYFTHPTHNNTYIVWPEDIDLTDSRDSSLPSPKPNNEVKEVLSWDDLLAKEKIKELYSMNYRPSDSQNYSIFLISDAKFPDSEQGNILKYYGTKGEKAQWLNEKFYDLAQQFKSKRGDAENIKIYFKKDTNKWECKGYYLLIDATLDKGEYKFVLQKAQKGYDFS